MFDEVFGTWQVLHKGAVPLTKWVGEGGVITLRPVNSEVAF